MNLISLVPVVIGLLPVLAFLAMLLYFDSYKLVKLPAVVAVIVAGALVAGASYLVNGAIIENTELDLSSFSHFVAPFSEEILKGLIVVGLIRLRRIGFLIDAAIFGFAVGAGFAVVENAYYYFARLSVDVGIGTWIIRGFGTAIMHGGTTAVFAMLGVNRLERDKADSLSALLPGYLLAVLIHAAYNLSVLPPIYTALLVLITLPMLLSVIFRRSEKSIGEWLGTGFDADAEVLKLINSGKLTDSPLGTYLSALKEKFSGPVVADILCYIRLHSELALRAKGLLIMRQNGFDVPMDSETQSKFDELRYLRQSIGKTGELAIQPMLHLSHKDLWQLYVLGK